VLPDGAIDEELVPLREDFTEWRKVERIENLDLGQNLPGEKKGNDADDTEPVRKDLTRALPPTIGGQRVRFVNGDEIEGILFILRRKISLRSSEPTLCAPDLAVKAEALAHSKSDSRFQREP
jgi:hypothetical protein